MITIRRADGHVSKSGRKYLAVRYRDSAQREFDTIAQAIAFLRSES